MMSACGDNSSSASSSSEQANEETKPKSTSRYNSLNAINEEIVSGDTKQGLMKRLYWYIDHGYWKDLPADAERLKNLDEESKLHLIVEAYVAIANSNRFEAKQLFEQALESKAAKKYAHLGLAELYLVAADGEQSILEVNNALREDQYFYRPYYQKGLVYLLAGDTSTAISSIRTACELNSEFYEGFKQMALIYYGANEKIYYNCLKTCLRIEPENPEINFMLGEYFQQKGQIEDAKKYYRKSLKLNKDYVLSSFNLGTLYLTEDNNIDSAKHFLQASLATSPNNVDAMFNLALCLKLEENTTGAKRLFEDILKLDPTYKAAKTELKSL